MILPKMLCRLWKACDVKSMSQSKEEEVSSMHKTDTITLRLLIFTLESHVLYHRSRELLQAFRFHLKLPRLLPSHLGGLSIWWSSPNFDDKGLGPLG